MTPFRATLARITALFRRHDEADRDLRAEMQAHLDMAIDENIRRGMSPTDARRRAIIESGGLVQAADHVREQRSIPWIESIIGDARYALRHFRRTPLSTITMILVLSLGIGTTVVMFTMLNSITTMPAPGIARDPSLARIRGSMQTKLKGTETRLLSWPEVKEYRARTDLFESVAAYAIETAAVSSGDATNVSTVRVIYVTPDYFSTLDVHPALGTEPVAEGDGMRMTSSPTAVISYGMWQQHFAGGRDAIGRTIRVNDVPVQIVGVAPRRFLGTDGGASTVVWIPLGAYPQIQKRTPAVFASRDSMFLGAAARLRPSVTTSNATPVAAAIAHKGIESASADVVPMLASNNHVRERGEELMSYAAIGLFSLLVLLITCTNVSALMVGLAVARRREIGVRLSLGAPRMRLMRQLLTESVLLSMLAAAAGLAMTSAGIRILESRLVEIQLIVDWRVTTATCAVAIATGVLFGLSPALHATRVSVGDVLKSSSNSIGASRSRLQQALVIAQVALTQPLLVGLGVVVLTIATDNGSRATSNVPAQIAEVEVDTWAGRVTNDERGSRINAIVQRVAAIPGVIAAMPMQGGTSTASLTVHPADRIAGRSYAMMQIGLVAAPNGYFDAFDVQVVRGRDFDAAERAGGGNDPGNAPAYDRIIIGSDMASRLFGDANPIGRRLVFSTENAADSSALTVIGVVNATTSAAAASNRFRVYVPWSAYNDGVVARTAGPALPLVSAIRRIVTQEAPQMPINRAETMEQRESSEHRDAMRITRGIAGAGLLALILSAIGLYAVISFAVVQRTREIGIRTTLGAQSTQVVRMFFTQGLGLSAIGLVIGLPLSMLAIRLIESNMHFPFTTSPYIGVAIGAVVLVVASVAVWIPARRASTIDPLIALRTE